MPKFQLTLIFWNFLLALLIFIVVLFQVASGMHDLKKMGNNAGFDADHPYFNFVRELSGNFYFHISIAFLIGMVISCFITLYVSHKMAGPLYRMRMFFEKLADEGAIKEISFRKGDYLTEFAEIINRALKKVSQEKK